MKNIITLNAFLLQGIDGTVDAEKIAASFSALNTLHILKPADVELSVNAEVCFIAAEAALRGWSAGNTAEEYYNRGVAASLGQYGQSSYSSSYLQQEKVSYNGTLKQIMTQKWLALWMSPEIWFDYRRTGLPDFQFGSGAIHPAMPVRLIYPEDEKLNNETNYTEAVEHLEQTDYSDGMHDSQYSKMWLIRGTENPW